MSRLPLPNARSCSARQDFKRIRARTQERDRDLSRVNLPFDVRAPNCATGDALRVEPGVKAFLFKIGLKALSEGGSVLASVGDENARWFGLRHRLAGNYDA